MQVIADDSSFSTGTFLGVFYMCTQETPIVSSDSLWTRRATKEAFFLWVHEKHFCERPLQKYRENHILTIIMQIKTLHDQHKWNIFLHIPEQINHLYAIYLKNKFIDFTIHFLVRKALIYISLKSALTLRVNITDNKYLLLCTCSFLR